MYYSGCCGGPAAFDIVEVLGCGRRWPGSMTLRRSHEVHEDTRSYSCTDHVSCLGVAAARGQRLLARPIFRAYESKLLALKEYIKESVYLQESVYYLMRPAKRYNVATCGWSPPNIIAAWHDGVLARTTIAHIVTSECGLPSKTSHGFTQHVC